MIGFILKLFAVKEIAEVTKNARIFKDYIWAAILNIIAGLILSWAFYDMWAKIPDLVHTPEKLDELISAFGMWTFIAVLIMIVGVWFMKKSYDAISRETGVKTFHTAALFYLIGAVLSLFLIGYFFILVGVFLEILAFFGLPEELPGEVPKAAEVPPKEPQEEAPEKAPEEAAKPAEAAETTGTPESTESEVTTPEEPEKTAEEAAGEEPKPEPAQPEQPGS
ncbi:DUF996 domain-containing protein [Thermococcus siculi]|uniref:DUF996 domain-containing protein n=1 Tax=Thermococcus siculi TaxID=72803 RepID=UPI001E36C2F4|nr:DUF996 domain-containing protein [Thermococcus siculi]